MSLINCEINLILTWSTNCFIIDAPANNQIPTFELTDTNLYVPVVTQGNAKPLQQLKQPLRNRCLDYLIDTSFQGVTRLFVLSFENSTG